MLSRFTEQDSLYSIAVARDSLCAGFVSLNPGNCIVFLDENDPPIVAD